MRIILMSKMFLIVISCLLLTACVPATGKADDWLMHTHTIKCVKYSENTCIEYYVFKVYKND